MKYISFERGSSQTNIFLSSNELGLRTFDFSDLNSSSGDLLFRFRLGVLTDRDKDKFRKYLRKNNNCEKRCLLLLSAYEVAAFLSSLESTIVKFDQ